MKHRAFMGKVMKALTEYKGIADNLAMAYAKEKAEFEEDLAQGEGKYTQEYMDAARRNWNPKTDYGKQLSAARQRGQKVADAYLNGIQEEMDGYFQIPVDSGFAATVTAIKSMGVTLNNREFSLLQDASKGYWGLRFLNELAVSRAKEKQVAVMEDGGMKNAKWEEKNPYNNVNLPDIEKVYDSLQSVRNTVNMAFDGYCGEGNALRDIVFPVDKAVEETNARLAEAYNVQPQRQVLDVLSISKMASAPQFFDENYPAYVELLKILDDMEATLPQPERKTELTEEDRRLIDTLINSGYPILAQSDAIKIAKADSRLAEILSLDERYGAGVRKALGEVTDNE